MVCLSARFAAAARAFSIYVVDILTIVELCTALVTGQLGNEIMAIINELSKLFGILDEDILKLE